MNSIKINVLSGQLDNATETALRKIKKGTYHKVFAEREIKLPKQFANDTLTKTSEYHCRLGCKWKNTIYGKNSQSNSTQTNNYVEKVENLIYYNTNTNTYYLRLIGTNNKYIKVKSQYRLNGKEISKKELIQKGYIKDTPYTDNGILMLKLENVLEIR